MIKEKPCKGTGKAKGHGCNEPQELRTYGLGHKCGCYPKWLFNTPEGLEKVEKAKLKATKPRRELEQRAKDEKETKSLATLLVNTRNTVHQYIRLRDKGKPCGSCGQPWHSGFQAGHVYKAELYSTIKFNELNIYGQCPKCNLRKDGNLTGYLERLPMRIGLDAFNELERLKSIDKHEYFKWDRESLNQIREQFKLKIKEL